jgi:sporulation protein YlmC with PRC-barrel domain
MCGGRIGVRNSCRCADPHHANPCHNDRCRATIPGNSMTVTEWYKQNVYDPQDNKIGEIMDVLMDHEGKATALIIGVGGFLGAGEKDVAVPFSAVQIKSKNNKPYLVMNATKDHLKSAKGFKYDRNAMNWMPEETTGTTGQGRR